jgi:hypothetical protein
MIQALGRGMTPLFIVDWITDKRLHLKLDHAHPVGAAPSKSSLSKMRSRSAVGST